MECWEIKETPNIYVKATKLTMLLSHQPQGTLNTLPVKSVTAAALTHTAARE